MNKWLAVSFVVYDVIGCVPYDNLKIKQTDFDESEYCVKCNFRHTGLNTPATSNMMEGFFL